MDLTKITSDLRNEVHRSQSNPKINIELELKIKDTTKVSFGILYAHFAPKEGATYINSINFINEIPDERFKTEIMTRTYSDDSTYKTSTSTKERIASAFERNLFSFNLSRETDISTNGTDVQNSTKIRIKRRKSYLVVVDGFKYKLDFTVVYSTVGSEFSRNPPRRQKEALFSLPIEKLLEESEYAFEVELELIDENKAKITPASLNKAVEYIMTIINPEYAKTKNLERRLQALIDRKILPDIQPLTLKRLLPNVVALTKNEYAKIYPPTGYFVADKTDGKRGLLITTATSSEVVVDGIHEFAAPKSKEIYVLDGEFIAAKSDKSDFASEPDFASGKSDFAPGKSDFASAAIPSFFAFDILVFKDQSVINKPFEERIKLIPDLQISGLKYYVKQYTRIEKCIEAEFTASRGKDAFDKSISFDGLIIVKPGAIYAQTETYKFKPMSHNSIDFLLKIAPKSVLGISPFVQKPGKVLYFMFVGISHDMKEMLHLQPCRGYSEMFPALTQTSYVPIQFASCNMPYAYLYYRDEDLDGLDGNIVEMRCVENCGIATTNILPTWEVVKVRFDRDFDVIGGRYFGNDYRIAELTWANYIDPFYIRDLWTVPKSYFTTEKEDMYTAQVHYNSFVKGKLISTHLNQMHAVIDVAAGKGQDLGRFMEAGIHDLYTLDIDTSALSELIRRRFEWKGKRSPMAIHVMQTDMNKPYTENHDTLKAHFGTAEFDGLVCNLAVHYFLDSAAAMKNFVDFCKAVVKSGGVVVITAFFGEEVNGLFKAAKTPAGKTWDVREDTLLKYSLRKDYAGSLLTVAGQKIGVKLPFSAGEYYVENLVNTAALTAEFKTAGFMLKSKRSFIDYLDEFKMRNERDFKLLSDDDKKYISLYGELVFKRR